jgi:hypothetical protein
MSGRVVNRLYHDQTPRAGRGVVATGRRVLLIQLARFEHAILGAAFEAPPVGERNRDHASHPGMRAAWLRHQPYA